MSFGKAFHNVGAAILKALSPYVLELDKGTRSRLDDQAVKGLQCLYSLPFRLGWILNDSSATDYSDITELAEEEEENFYKHAVALVQENQEKAEGN